MAGFVWGGVVCAIDKESASNRTTCQWKGEVKVRALCVWGGGCTHGGSSG